MTEGVKRYTPLLLLLLGFGCDGKPTQPIPPSAEIIAEADGLGGPSYILGKSTGKASAVAERAVYTSVGGYAPQAKRNIRWRMDWRSVSGRVRWWGWGYFSDIGNNHINIAFSYTTKPDTAGSVWYDITYIGDPPTLSGKLWEDYFRAEQGSAGVVRVWFAPEACSPAWCLSSPYLASDAGPLTFSIERDTLVHAFVNPSGSPRRALKRASAILGARSVVAPRTQWGTL